MSHPTQNSRPEPGWLFRNSSGVMRPRVPSEIRDDCREYVGHLYRDSAGVLRPAHTTIDDNADSCLARGYFYRDSNRVLRPVGFRNCVVAEIPADVVLYGWFAWGTPFVCINYNEQQDRHNCWPPNQLGTWVYPVCWNEMVSGGYEMNPPALGGIFSIGNLFQHLPIGYSDLPGFYDLFSGAVSGRPREPVLTSAGMKYAAPNGGDANWLSYSSWCLVKIARRSASTVRVWASAQFHRIPVLECARYPDLDADYVVEHTPRCCDPFDGWSENRRCSWCAYSNSMLHYSVDYRWTQSQKTQERYNKTNWNLGGVTIELNINKQYVPGENLANILMDVRDGLGTIESTFTYGGHPSISTGGYILGVGNPQVAGCYRMNLAVPTNTVQGPVQVIHNLPGNIFGASNDTLVVCGTIYPEGTYYGLIEYSGEHDVDCVNQDPADDDFLEPLAMAAYPLMLRTHGPATLYDNP